MHDISVLWHDIFAEPNHRKEVMVKVNGVEYHESRILYPAPSIVGKLFDAPGVGNCRARTLTLNLMPYDGPSGRIPPMSEIRLFVRLKSADGQCVSEYIQKGVFYVDEVSRERVTGATRITAFDAMMKMERQFGNAVVRVVFNDGFGGIQRYRRNVGDPMPTSDSPAHEGERFLAWYPNPADTPTLARDMLFTARWAKKFTVTFDDGNGTPQTFPCFEGDITPEPAAPTKGGYAFTGWTPTPAATVTADAIYNAQWEEVGIIVSGDWWKLHEDGSLNIFCEGAMPYREWNDYLNSITSVTIASSVTQIRGYAFSGCSNLTSVIIPNSVTVIGEGSFSHCSKLTNITIPDSVTSIGGNAFSGCSNLTSVIISNSLTAIGAGGFFQCSKLTNITLPDSLMSIAALTFLECSSLTSVTIPYGVTTISSSTFTDCSGLTSVAIPDSVTEIEGAAFRGCSHLPSVTIPNSVRSIGVDAFRNCYRLTSVTIGEGVRSIDKYAFYRCDDLTDVYYAASAEEWASIAVGRYNYPLTSATIHYNSSGPA